jgi:hypothetical protein
MTPTVAAVVARDNPLHIAFGAYVKRLRAEGCIEPEMAERILKSSISAFESFNDVRNNKALAHDNPLLAHEESLLVFNWVAATVRFIRALEAQIKDRKKATGSFGGDVPF